MQHPSVVDLELNETLRRIGIFGVPLARYVDEGTHGAHRLREKTEAENKGVTIPLAVRWAKL